MNGCDLPVKRLFMYSTEFQEDMMIYKIQLLVSGALYLKEYENV